MTTQAIIVESATVEGTVSPLIHGHFLEHIYKSVVEGLDGQLVRDPGFEEQDMASLPEFTVLNGTWETTDNVLSGVWATDDGQVLFGPAGLRDFEFVVEARKDFPGWHAFSIPIRAAGTESQCTWFAGQGSNLPAAERRRMVQREAGAVLPMGGTSAQPERTPFEGTASALAAAVGAWHELRVVCEGTRIRCFFDGETDCEFTDASLRSGRVGVGVRRTTGSFRNARVTVGGEVVWRQPQSAHGGGTSAQWSIVPGGEGARYELSLADPLNSRKCQRIACDAGRAGVQQAGIPVEPGVEYTGSLWIRGQALSVWVELLGCGTPPVAAGGGSDTWREVPLRFCPTVRADGAVLRITAEGPCDLRIDQVTLRRADTPWRPAIHSQLKALQPAFIRWPGGCYAEWYRWKDGVGPLYRRTTAPNFMWGGLDPNHFGTDEFLRLCHGLGAEPVMVLNIGQHMPAESRADYIAEALEWIEYCNGDTTTPNGALRAASGHPEPYGVKYWEIGNETWGMGAPMYAEYLEAFSQAIRERHPDLVLLGCGTGGFYQKWNEEILEAAAQHFDYLSIHVYTHGTPEEEFAEGWRKYPEFLDETAALIARSANPGMKVAVTEWNEQSTWLRGGIYAGLLLNEMERRSDVVAMACPALLIRNVDAPAWDNAFINHDGVRAFAAPNALVAGLYRTNYCRERVKASGPDELNVLALRECADGNVIVRIVNPSGEAVETRLVLDGNPVDCARTWQLAGGVNDRNSLFRPEAVRVVEGETGADLTVPAHSVTVVRVAREGRR